MILNKVTISPFLPPPPPLTPRLLNRNKKMQINNLRCQLSSDKQKEPLHFDDTICFTQLNRNIAGERTPVRERQAKKCVSQILTIKHVQQSPATDKKIPVFEHSSHRNTHIHRDVYQLGLLCEWNREEYADSHNHNNSSHSTRKRSWNYKIQQECSPVFTERHRDSLPNPSHKQTMFPPSKCPQSAHSISPSKTLNANVCQDNRLDLRIGSSEKNRGQSQNRNKKNNFFQYSIIKPDQIKSLALKRRQGDKQLIDRRRKDQRTIYIQMLQQMKKKEQILKRHALMQQQVQTQAKRQRPLEMRGKIYTSSNRRPNVCQQQKNQLNPWEVQGIPLSNSNFIDIL